MAQLPSAVRNTILNKSTFYYRWLQITTGHTHHVGSQFIAVCPVQLSTTVASAKAHRGEYPTTSHDWIKVQADAWCLHLKIEKGLRFPSIDVQIPSRSSATTRLVLSDEDIDFLLTSIRQRPDAADDHAPVIVDLNGVVAIRAESIDRSNIAELVHRNSSSTGHQIRFHTDRGFLVRAVQLGFREICLRSNIGPAFCQDDRQNYFWAFLTEEQGLPPVPGSPRSFFRMLLNSAQKCASL